MQAIETSGKKKLILISFIDPDEKGLLKLYRTNKNTIFV
jgi:hypothetical protein